MKLILIACAVLLLILAGCTQQAAGTQNNVQPSGNPAALPGYQQALPSYSPPNAPPNAAPVAKDCGANMACFRAALENNCQDAFALTTSGILHQIQLEGNACAYSTAVRVNASTDEFMPALGTGLEVPIQKCTGSTQNGSVLLFAGKTKSILLPIETDSMNLTNNGYQITWYTNQTKNNACIYIQDNGNVLFFSHLLNTNTSSQ